MCGRFASVTDAEWLASYFTANVETELEERYNVAPTTPVYAVLSESLLSGDQPLAGELSDGEQRVLVAMRWGLLPHWAKDQRDRPLINARAETVATNNAFARSFAERRCLIPADGFYEWAAKDDKVKQPYYIYHRDEEPLAFAGIWRSWRPPGAQGDELGLATCSIITCAANSTMSKVHDRMPAILPPSSWDAWLSPSSEPADLVPQLKPAPEELLVLRPVSTDVNNSRNDGPKLIEPADGSTNQQRRP